MPASLWTALIFLSHRLYRSHVHVASRASCCRCRKLIDPATGCGSNKVFFYGSKIMITDTSGRSSGTQSKTQGNPAIYHDCQMVDHPIRERPDNAKLLDLTDPNDLLNLGNHGDVHLTCHGHLYSTDSTAVPLEISGNVRACFWTGMGTTLSTY